VARWVEKSYELLEFLNHPKPIRSSLYLTNQLERLMKEVKRRTRTVGVFGCPEALEKVSYLVLVEKERTGLGREVLGYAKTQTGNCHGIGIHKMRHC